MRNRKRIKYALITLRLVKLIRLTYVFVEDIFLTCYWYYLTVQDYAVELVCDFYIFYEEYFLEMENLAYVFWYNRHIFREQVLYFQVASRVLWGRPQGGRVARLLR